MSQDTAISPEKTPYEVFAWKLAVEDRNRELAGSSRTTRAARRITAVAGYKLRNRESVRPKVVDAISTVEITSEAMFSGAIDSARDTIQAAREAMQTVRNRSKLSNAIEDTCQGQNIDTNMVQTYVLSEIYGVAHQQPGLMERLREFGRGIIAEIDAGLPVAPQGHSDLGGDK